MAQKTSNSQQTPTKTNFLPKTTDPRAELFFLLGTLQGSGAPVAMRITELVIDLTLIPEDAVNG